MSDPAKGRGAFVREYLSELAALLEKLPVEPLEQALEILEDAFNQRKQVLIAGNGGSAATASHLQNDLMLGVAKMGRGGFRAISLADCMPTITAIANDDGYDQIFSQQLGALATPGDVFLVITGSGNSPNILRALATARDLGLTTIGWLGMDGGAAAPLCDVAIIVPSTDYGAIENVHMVYDHLTMAYFSRWVSQREK